MHSSTFIEATFIHIHNKKLSALTIQHTTYCRAALVEVMQSVRLPAICSNDSSGFSQIQSYLGLLTLDEYLIIQGSHNLRDIRDWCPNVPPLEVESRGALGLSCGRCYERQHIGQYHWRIWS